MATSKTPEPSPLERVTAWAEADPDLSLDDQGRLVMAGRPPVTISVTANDEVLMLTYRTDSASGTPTLPGRASAVRSELADGTLILSSPVYLDGLNRQSFTAALRSLVGVVDEMGPPGFPTTRPLPAERVTDEPAPTREMPAVWTPTHAVPTGGTRAWADPDPAQDPITTLEARVRLSIAERRGDWARVVGSNGWTGWVDARVLEPVGAETSQSATSSGLRIRPLSAVGAVVIALSAFLPWVSLGNLPSSNAFDVSARFLFDFTAAGAPDLVWVILVVAAVALIPIDRLKSVPVLAGLAAIAIAGLFAVQIYRGVSDGGGTFSDVMDLIGFAPLLTAAGGVLVIVGTARK